MQERIELKRTKRKQMVRDEKWRFILYKKLSLQGKVLCIRINLYFFFAGMGKMLSDVRCKDIPRYSKTD